MKQIKTLVIVAMLGAVSFTACKKDSTDPTLPNLTVTSTPNTTTVEAGQVITINVVSTASIASFKIQEDVPGQSALTTDSSSDKVGNKTLNIAYKYKVPTGAATKTITVSVVDNSGTSNSASLTFTIVSMKTCSSAVLGNQNNTVGSSFATSDCSVLSVSQAKANASKVDFVHFFGATNAATLAAPSDKADLGAFSAYDINNWSVNNATMFAKLPASFDFASVSYSSLATAYAGVSSSAANKAASLAISDMYAFKTAAGKYGVFQVTNLSGTSSSSGAITINVKTQN